MTIITDKTQVKHLMLYLYQVIVELGGNPYIYPLDNMVGVKVGDGGALRCPVAYFNNDKILLVTVGENGTTAEPADLTNDEELRKTIKRRIDQVKKETNEQ